MKRYVSKFAVCPCYKHESRQMIDCDGLENNTVIHYAFANASECLEFKRKRCRSGYCECPIFRMLELQKKRGN